MGDMQGILCRVPREPHTHAQKMVREVSRLGGLEPATCTPETCFAEFTPRFASLLCPDWRRFRYSAQKLIMTAVRYAVSMSWEWDMLCVVECPGLPKWHLVV